MQDFGLDEADITMQGAILNSDQTRCQRSYIHVIPCKVKKMKKKKKLKAKYQQTFSIQRIYDCF